MRFDLDVKPVTGLHDADVCVIGSGPAGMTLALALADAGKSVCLMEGGGETGSDASQDCYRGETLGDPYFPLDHSRLRFLGGTSNHWAGWCRWLDEIDFLPREENPLAHWPIRKRALDRYLPRACEVLEIPPPRADRLVSARHGIKEIHFSFSPPVRFGARYAAHIEASDAITLVLNANLVDLPSPDGRVRRAVFRSYEGHTTVVRAGIFVLAMGGIENSRMLQWIDRRNNGALLRHDMPTGRYWMEHPHFTIAEALVDMRQTWRRFFSLTPSRQRRLGIFNCGLRLEPLDANETWRLVGDLRVVAPKLARQLADLAGGERLRGGRVRAAWEQEPRFENRVALSAAAFDRFGVPRVELHNRRTARDLATVRRTVKQYGAWLRDTGLGRLKVADWVFGEADYPRVDEIGGNHHMGGTRMADNPRDGVVDETCRVFGHDNLYVCGSSVFPTGGHVNPTLTIVQLSLRLADHVAGGR